MYLLFDRAADTSVCALEYDGKRNKKSIEDEDIGPWKGGVVVYCCPAKWIRLCPPFSVWRIHNKQTNERTKEKEESPFAPIQFLREEISPHFLSTIIYLTCRRLLFLNSNVIFALGSLNCHRQRRHMVITAQTWEIV